MTDAPARAAVTDGIPLRRELECARRLAVAAGDAAMRHYGSALPELKSCDSPVTIADRAANDVIVRGLAAEFPADAILSEESADSPARLAARRVWVVDPLDGTKEFLAQNGEFSIMIGLAIDGAAHLGVVYAPATRTLYSAVSGGGAVVERDGVAHPLRREAPQGSLRLVGSRSHADPRVTAIQRALAIDVTRPSGSVGIKCALIAEDECDLYVHPVPYMKEWDTCAPEVILSEAGGVVVDCHGDPLRYNKPDPRQPQGILAAAPEVLERVLDTVRSVAAPALAG